MSKRILVVEDQPDNRQIIRDMLAPTDYEITEAENGEEALAAIAKQRPDLILMDTIIGKKRPPNWWPKSERKMTARALIPLMLPPGGRHSHRARSLPRGPFTHRTRGATDGRHRPAPDAGRRAASGGGCILVTRPNRHL